MSEPTKPLARVRKFAAQVVAERPKDIGLRAYAQSAWTVRVAVDPSIAPYRRDYFALIGRRLEGSRR